jgi:hypothetical protein
MANAEEFAKEGVAGPKVPSRVPVAFGARGWLQMPAMAADQNRALRREAVLTLEAAARKNQSQAEEARRKLGWR